MNDATMNQAIRIVMVDDHAVVRAGLRMLIDSQPGMMVVAEAGTADEALEAVASAHPDIILLDIDLAGESSLPIIPTLLASASGGEVLVLTGLRDVDLHRQAVLQGAMGVVLKEHAVEVLLTAIEHVHRGDAWLARSLMTNILRDRLHPPASADEHAAATLTPREWDVIGLVCDGLKNREIAERLVISEATVRHHLTSIFSKLGVADRFELVVHIFRSQIIPPPRHGAN